MAVRIVIDAGHGGYDAGATYNERREKDDTLALALAVGEILEAQGYDVVYTRTEDVYDSPVQKARIGNDSGADFFVSIHRNSSPTPNQYNGVQTLVYNNSGIKAAMAENVNQRLEEVGYRNINVAERPDLAVLRRTRMPAILVEAGFINSDVDNELFDTRFSETAEAIARGIDETIRDAGYGATVSAMTKQETESYHNRINPYYGIPQAMPAFSKKDAGKSEGMPTGTVDTQNPKEMQTGTVDTQNPKEMQTGTVDAQNPERMQMGQSEELETTGYQILVGIYRTFGTASYQANRFLNAGYEAQVVEDEGLYQVRIGRYETIEDALIAQRELRDRGYDTLIVR